MQRIQAVFLFYSFFILSGNLLFAQDKKISPDVCMRSMQLYYTISNHHISGQINSAEYGKRVAEKLIEELDYYGIFFTQSDIDLIREAKFRLTFDLIVGSCSFAEEVFNIYKEKVTAFDSIMSTNEIWENDFSMADTLLLYGKYNKLEYKTNQEELVEKIKKRLKYLTLIEYQTSLDSLEGSFKDFESKKENLIENIRTMEACRLAQIFESEETLLDTFMERFLKALAVSFDPHTNYMSIKEMSQFESSLSEEIYSTGLVLDPIRSGTYVVSGIIPGSAASDLKEIEEGDEVLKISSNGEEIHPACLKPADLAALLNNPEPKEVSLSLKKQKGNVVKVNIEKSLIENINNEIGSLILEDSIKVGYVSLPSFYQSMDDPLSNSSQDIATQIQTFKNKNVDGLILDLRFNGGGSVQEAVDLASLFVNGGPLIQEISKEGRTILKDKDKRIIYEGKLIILVNALSASASEMFVSMMHQHKRALIVGNQTYGKASGQMMGPLTLPEDTEEYGALKLTVLRYYNLTGDTFQKRGFKPDIFIPDGFPKDLFGESLQDYALDAQSFNKRVKVKSKSASIPFDQLKERSQERQKENDIYSQLQLFRDSIVTVMNEVKAMPLQVEKFIETTQNISYDSSKYDYPLGDQFKMEVISGITQFGADTDKQLRYNMGTDPTLREAINIMRDWSGIIPDK
ncbi:MAG: hypothetical protein JXR03_07735 [Cyclobacteriaceae bacterium]